MASQTFSFVRSIDADPDVQESASIAIGAGEALRVRFSDFPGSLNGADAFLVISANAVESTILIEDQQAWVTGAVAEGDDVKLRLRFEGRLGTIAGIIEGFSS